MPRIRSVHPSLFTDEAWVSCSPLARVLYIGLMTDADDQGLFEWKPLQIRMRLLPGDNADVPALLAELEAANLIGQLESAGKKLGAIRYFRRFQRPKKPTATYLLPAEWRTYVGLKADGSEPEDDEGGVSTEPEPVKPRRVPPNSEISPQMEDGGGVGSLFSDADASSPESRPKGQPSGVDPAIVETLWACQPVCGGKRKATRPEVAKALSAALKRGGDPAAIEAAFRAYYALPDCTRDGGQFAKGAAVLLNDDKWRDFAPSSPAAPLGLDWPETRWAAAVTIWRADGAWHEDLGPTPGQPGCRVPAHVLIQPATGATA